VIDRFLASSDEAEDPTPSRPMIPFFSKRAAYCIPSKLQHKNPDRMADGRA
jgi:hypothetical protein